MQLLWDNDDDSDSDDLFSILSVCLSEREINLPYLVSLVTHCKGMLTTFLNINLFLTNY